MAVIVGTRWGFFAVSCVGMAAGVLECIRVVGRSDVVLCMTKM